MTIPDILIVTDYYLPGYKGGGPIRTIAGLVSNLGKEFRFRVLTTDRDWRDPVPYSGIERDRWVESFECPVCYLSLKAQSLRSLHRFLKNDSGDVLYLNGIFSRLTVKLLFLRYLGLLPHQKVILAPRGMLAMGSYRLKWWKKRPYLFLTKFLRFYRGIAWNASSESEVEDIHREFPAAVTHETLPISKMNREMVFLTSEIISDRSIFRNEMRRPDKKAGEARFVFLSRITRVKNLEGVLKILSKIRSTVSLDIYGPVDDEAYWNRCRERITALPGNVTVRYHGPIPNNEAMPVLARHEFLFLPTFGENFGHVIIEALSAGVPAIISDLTPWRGLESANAGWDLPLEDEDGFVAILERCAAMKPEEYELYSHGAKEFIRQVYKSGDALNQNRELFTKTLSMG